MAEADKEEIRDGRRRAVKRQRIDALRMWKVKQRDSSSRGSINVNTCTCLCLIRTHQVLIHEVCWNVGKANRIAAVTCMFYGEGRLSTKIGFADEKRRNQMETEPYQSNALASFPEFT